MYYGRSFRIFWEKELDQVLRSKLLEMQKLIEGKSDDYILNVNETEFINYLVSLFSADILDLKFGDVHISTYEKDIPSERFPGSGFLFNVEPGRRYKKDVIKYHVPFVGSEEWLSCMPNPRAMRTIEVSLEEGCVCFEIINFDNNVEGIKQEADSAIELMRRQLEHLAQQLRGYNNSLQSQAQQLFQQRKHHLLHKGNLLAALGVPIKKLDDVPLTFAIPTPQTRKQIKVIQPQVIEKGYKPEPSLDLRVYKEILQIIHDVGKQFERMPSTYADKSEEALRDHLLLFLEPQFEGSATGETFNKTGKTDILLRYQGSNVFIAECKFWKGAKAYLETVTQLLGYLTWRDSKAAIIIFVRNKDLSSVINMVESETPKHSNFLGFSGKNDETWFDYRVHINKDPNREVKMAVLLFHIPQT